MKPELATLAEELRAWRDEMVAARGRIAGRVDLRYS